MIGEDYFTIRAQLGTALFSLQTLAGDLGAHADTLSTLQQLQQSLREPFLFVVAGEVKAGKSSLLNALFGREFCKVDVLPATDRIYIFKYGDEERTVLAGVPGLSDIPLLGRLFANNHRETQQTDIILTLTPHIVRVLDLTEADLRSFRLGRDAGTTSLSEILGGPGQTPRDDAFEQPGRTQPPAAAPTAPSGPPPVSFPQPLIGRLPGTNFPVTAPPKKPGGGES